MEVREIPAAAPNPWPFPGRLRPIARLLTKGERRELIDKKHLSEYIDSRLDTVQWRSSGFAGVPPAMREVRTEAFPTGYLSGLTEAAGCKDGTIRADLTYSPEGRPHTVALREPEKSSEECARAARIAAVSHPFALYRLPDEAHGRWPEPGPETLTSTSERRRKIWHRTRSASAEESKRRRR